MPSRALASSSKNRRAWVPTLARTYRRDVLASRNALYRTGAASHSGARIDWSGHHRFETSALRALIDCDVCKLQVFVAAHSVFSGAPFGLHDLPTDLPLPLQLAAAESLLRQPLEMLAQSLGSTVRNITFVPEPLKFEDAVRAGLAFVHLRDAARGVDLYCAVLGEPPAALRQTSQFNLVTAAAHGWTIDAAWRIPIGRLALTSLQTIQVGMGLPIGPSDRQASAAELWAGYPSRRLAAAHLSGNTMTIDSLEPRPADSVTTQGPDALHPRDGSAPRIGQLGVRVAIELASLQYTLGELAALRPGAVVELDRSLLSAAVAIVVGGQPVGQGLVVALDDGLAVEITEWSLTTEDPPHAD